MVIVLIIVLILVFRGGGGYYRPGSGAPAEALASGWAPFW
jgi:hypothetical protein